MGVGCPGNDLRLSENEVSTDLLCYIPYKVFVKIKMLFFAKNDFNTFK